MKKVEKEFAEKVEDAEGLNNLVSEYLGIMEQTQKCVGLLKSTRDEFRALAEFVQTYKAGLGKFLKGVDLGEPAVTLGKGLENYGELVDGSRNVLNEIFEMFEKIVDTPISEVP